MSGLLWELTLFGGAFVQTNTSNSRPPTSCSCSSLESQGKCKKRPNRLQKMMSKTLVHRARRSQQQQQQPGEEGQCADDPLFTDTDTLGSCEELPNDNSGVPVQAPPGYDLRMYETDDQLSITSSDSSSCHAQSSDTSSRGAAESSIQSFMRGRQRGHHVEWADAVESQEVSCGRFTFQLPLMLLLFYLQSRHAFLEMVFKVED